MRETLPCIVGQEKEFYSSTFRSGPISGERECIKDEGTDFLSYTLFKVVATLPPPLNVSHPVNKLAILVIVVSQPNCVKFLEIT